MACYFTFCPERPTVNPPTQCFLGQLLTDKILLPFKKEQISKICVQDGVSVEEERRNIPTSRLQSKLVFQKLLPDNSQQIS
jgi:hypothetical protein